jgi:hypothetical protein
MRARRGRGDKTEAKRGAMRKRVGLAVEITRHSGKYPKKRIGRRPQATRSSLHQRSRFKVRALRRLAAKKRKARKNRIA